ncbi:sucrose-phosphate synthase [Ectothiorhodosinus mongolicus]|uniref:sucrose-phosphate synthase n=1 Tax=Ectothiorhodosinus mongolicus TaxID=233100 RepID=A0A1R3W033_9GAMM|nr:HAD-IIB family hydrolase [Ectothiorhodosinus mongolicus]ULX57260.1 HAD family hydrolase [Ectothiorhodosinus mongolicus]SIT70684.1 sucrose-phosphate synthase [Ectothiorhodosinus mongolicus]
MKRTQRKASRGEGLYIVLVSVHGLIRGSDLELGRDADTGGQIKYVVELARALGAHPEVGRVDLLTRRIDDQRVDPAYAQAEETLAEGVRVIRLDCGPKRYLRKERLWPHLDCFADNAIKHIRHVGLRPDVVHGHYADAGYAAVRIANLLGAPLVQTGHSLGRVKQQRLMEKGASERDIESRYNMAQRIDAEEETLLNAYRVIASTQQEVESQYALYDHYRPERMEVIPPGTDLERFHPPPSRWRQPPIAAELKRFLRHPQRPIVMALSRPDERKNIPTLVRAFAEHGGLRELANLVIVAGNRDSVRSLDRGARKVLTEVFMLIDDYDLHGQVAYPKHHAADDVPDLYRLVTHTRGVFVNPALTEPFGLTLIEAGASGAPFVATADGGPKDILRHCQNGVLVDPLDSKAMSEAIYQILADDKRWKALSTAGLKGVRKHYSWRGHADTYVRKIKPLGAEARRVRRGQRKLSGKLVRADRALITDIDNTLLGDRQGLKRLLNELRSRGSGIAFGIATGRRLDSAVQILKEWGVPTPDLMITSVGAEIHYAAEMTEDPGWMTHINYRWRPEALREAILELPGIDLQPEEDQRRHKISFFVDPTYAPGLREIERLLRQQDLQANLIYSHDRFLDLLPLRASKGFAVRYFADKWGIELERVLVAGDSGNDEDMLRGRTLGVVVGNHAPELERLRGYKRVHFAKANYAGGIVEALEHYDFFNECRAPDQ